jgi:hypothetical protein
MMKYFEEAIRAERLRQAAAPVAAVPAVGSPKKGSEDEWSDVEDEQDFTNFKVAKTVELA